MLRSFVGATACILLAVPARADDWPQWMGPQRDGIWRETGILDKFPEGGPKVLWRSKIAGGYAGPAVADGRVYVHDFLTDADPRKVSNPMSRPALKGKERIHCLDARTGKPLWTHEYDVDYRVSYPAGPRCTPTVHDGKVYALGAMGNLLCLDAVSGKVVWDRNLPKDYQTEVPIWGYAAHPLVDGKKLICVVGGKGSVAVAFDKDTGKEFWKALSAPEPGYCPPSLIEAGGKRQVLIWHVQAIESLDPETGKVYWSVPLEPQFGMAIAAPRKHGDHLFAGAIGFRSVLIKLAKDKPAAEAVWRGTNRNSIYPVNCTPVVVDGILYGVDQPGILRAVRFETGERLWETTALTTGERPANSGTGFLVKNGDRFFIFNEKGELIIARLTPEKFDELGRAKLLEPTQFAFGRDVVWSHPAFAGKCMFARNDKELICVSLVSQ